MNRILKNLSVALMLAGAPAALMLETAPAQAQAADPAVQQVQGFYDALLASMKSGGTTKSRYDRLKPAVDKAFDLAGHDRDRHGSQLGDHCPTPTRRC
jgi:hypothetical protein